MARPMKLHIIHEDAELVVIDKPAGLLSMASDTEKSATAYRQVSDYVRAKNRKNRIFIVHRLDRDTSGVLIFAKNEGIKRALQNQWNDIILHRGYLAIVAGAPPQKSGTVRSFLLENSVHVVYSAPERMGGKEAITNYTVLAQRKGFSLLDLSIDTGRKNQIRVHMKDLGCPVVGDKKYGEGGKSPLGRLALHADALSFTHPVSGKELSFTSIPPTEFARLFPTGDKKPR